MGGRRARIEQGAGSGVERGAGGRDVVDDQNHFAGDAASVGRESSLDVAASRVEVGLLGLLGRRTGAGQGAGVEGEREPFGETTGEDFRLVVAASAAAAAGHRYGGQQLEVAGETGEIDSVDERQNGRGESIVFDGKDGSADRAVEDEGGAQAVEGGRITFAAITQPRMADRPAARAADAVGGLELSDADVAEVSAARVADDAAGREEEIECAIAHAGKHLA